MGPLTSARFSGMHLGIATGDDQSLPAVVIEIDKTCAEADVGFADGGNSACGRAEKERTVAPISVQSVQFVLVVRHPQRRAAGTVEIRDINPLAAVRHAAIIACDAAGESRLFQHN